MAPRLSEKGASEVESVLRLILSRALLLALPFVLYALWSGWARRNGGAARAAPWGWLAGAGALLVGLSLMATALFHHDNRGEAYVPAEAHPGGKVTPAGFDARQPRAPVSPASPNTAP